MKKHLLSLGGILISTLSIFAQCDNGRYHQKIFANYSLESDVVYGSNVTYQGAAQSLTMDIYQPEGDGTAPRALVVVAHGGSFITGSKTGPDVVGFCQDMVKMGYVVASINYRLGFGIANLQAEATAAVMRGTQDLKAAIRYFRKSAAENGNPYNINPDLIYSAGVSAGGFCALHLAYLDQPEELPSFLNMNATGIDNSMEGLSGNAGYSSEINALVNICGALGDTAWIHAGDEPAMLLHGTNDNTVPYGSAVLSLFGFAVTEVDGSYSISQRMNEVNVEHCFEIHEGQDHVPSLSNEAYYDTTLSFMTQFLAQQICQYNFNCQYAPVASNTPEIHTSVFHAYPNPAHTQLTLVGLTQAEEVMVYNAQGQWIQRMYFYPGESVPVEQLPQGMYFLVSPLKTFETVTFIKE
ncbi:MAG: T9SS type A sorting domain-containing protein [Bacteroidetes bacterium]|nr:T9SS type A sorting domain-containing protein [Bacteroidota bacterium]